MDTQKILTADILDIIFDGRNKDYGAYDLRKNYNGRLKESMIIVGLTILLISILILSYKPEVKKERLITISDRILTDVKPAEKLPEKIKPTNPVSHSSSPSNTIPVIVKDTLDMKKTPTVTEILNSNGNGTNNNNPATGNDSTGIAKNPPFNTPAVTKADPAPESNKPVIPEVQAEFPGGAEAWRKYIIRAIQKNIDELTDAGEAGTCRVRFIVDKDGAVSDVEATTMKGTKLAEISVNVIRNGPHWIPARQSGLPVKAYRLQPVTFTIQE